MRLNATLERYLNALVSPHRHFLQKLANIRLQCLAVGRERPEGFRTPPAVARFIGTSIDALMFDDDVSIAIFPRGAAGFFLDDDGWHKGVVEVWFRHFSCNKKKS